MKDVHTEAFVIFFEKSPYINGAKNAPANAPQEIDISVEIIVFGLVIVNIAIPTEIIRKTAMNILIITTCFFSVIFLQNGLIRSIVRVDDEVKTKLERVDIEADKTSTITTPIRMSGIVDIICGTM